MKIKALDSFSASEVGMVHAGGEFDASEVSEERLDEWRAKGFIPKAEAAPLNKAAAAPQNKAAQAKPKD